MTHRESSHCWLHVSAGLRDRSPRCPRRRSRFPVSNDGHFSNTINSVAINRNNLVTFGDYQYVAFYDQFRNIPGPNDQATVMLGRRLLGTNSWDVFDTNRQPVSIGDDHDTVAIAIDGNGLMHMSWGMHNNPMNYVVSNARVDLPTFTGTTFTQPSAWPQTAGTTHDRTTYPEFYTIPGSNDLMFVYRQGGTGGGSGNGDQYFVRYDASNQAWNKTRVINGQADSVNAYPNNLVYDSSGDLLMSWTWRDTPAFQSNHNILFARSGDDGVTWTKQDGTPYALPITRPQAQVIANIPQNSTLINTTGMAVDSADNPLIATWYAPLASQGDHTRQYMLHYYDGSAWQVSQITDRPTEPMQNDSTVRELARPIVLVDDDDRTLVVMRYKEVDDNIVVGISEDKLTWDFITLASADMGIWEPTYDAALWERENKLHLFYQQLGAGGNANVAVLEWDAKGYFASIPEPGAAAALLVIGATTLLLRRTTRARAPRFVILRYSEGSSQG